MTHAIEATKFFAKRGLIFLALLGSVSLGARAQTTIRVIACGGPYTDSKGNVWAADASFTGGSCNATTTPITGSASDAKLYQSERYNAFSYSFPVPPGSYSVTLKFAEIYYTSAGQRVFNVLINGTQVLSNFDIFKDSGGEFYADDKTFPVTSTGLITIQFQNGSANYAKVDAIQILPATGAPTPPVLSNKQAVLGWTASTSSVSGYNVYRSGTSGGPYTKLVASPIAGLTYTDSTVLPGNTYYYVVTSVDSSGRESSYSNEAVAVIPPSSTTPPGPRAITCTGSVPVNGPFTMNCQ